MYRTLSRGLKRTLSRVMNHCMIRVMNHCMIRVMNTHNILFYIANIPFHKTLFSALSRNCMCSRTCKLKRTYIIIYIL